MITDRWGGVKDARDRENSMRALRLYGRPPKFKMNGEIRGETTRG